MPSDDDNVGRLTTAADLDGLDFEPVPPVDNDDVDVSVIGPEAGAELRAMVYAPDPLDRYRDRREPSLWRRYGS